MSISISKHGTFNQRVSCCTQSPNADVLLQNPQKSQPADNAGNNCCGSCCSGSLSKMDEALAIRLEQMLHHDKLDPEDLVDVRRRLRCVPLDKSRYRFLNQQLGIATDYVLGDDTGNIKDHWGALFHLRMFIARIRSTKESSNGQRSNCAVENHDVAEPNISCCRH